MKSSIIKFVKKFKPLGLVFLFMTGLASNALAQVPKQQGRCTAKADQIYFVASGQMVIDVYPGSNGGNGYQLNILGNGADNFELIKEAHMATAYVIAGYTGPTAAKWQIEFAPNMERVICSVKMKNKCTGETLSYPLTVGARLFNR